MAKRCKRSYFKVRSAENWVGALFFFETDDRESIEVAYRDAVEEATRVGRSPDDISVWVMPSERGAWTPTRANRGVNVIGEVRNGQSETGQLQN